MSARALRPAAWVVALGLLAAGCATAPPRGEVASPLPSGRRAAAAPSPSPSPAPPGPGTTVGTTASGGRIVSTSPSAAAVDTLPSADAVAVLETIPEPLSPSQRVPAPRLPASHPAADDSAGTGEQATPEPEADVPVPQETKPLGDRPSPVAADSTPPPPASPPPPSGEAARAAPDTCWRVQVAAVPEPERAQALRAAAESQTLVAWVIEEEAKLLKVRSKNCMSGADSNELRRRAVAAGFTGAFRFRKPSP